MSDRSTCTEAPVFTSPAEYDLMAAPPIPPERMKLYLWAEEQVERGDRVELLRDRWTGQHVALVTHRHAESDFKEVA